MASVGRLRGMLPNGVPKMVCAVPALRMKRTWSLVMGNHSAGQRVTERVGGPSAAVLAHGRQAQECVGN